MGDAGTEILLAGGLTSTGAGAGVRLFNTTTCSFETPWLGPGLAADGGGSEAAFSQAQAFLLDPTHVVVVGTEKGSGTLSAYELTQGGKGNPAIPVTFRAPHSLANAIILPNGSLAVVGGSATMESYIR